MALTINSSLKATGDRDMYLRTAKRLKDRRPLLRRVGVLMMSSAAGRLTRVLKQGDNVARSGRLAKSIAVGTQGRGSGDTIFRMTNSSVAVGSNLPYAAQVHFGGTIVPRKGKALAIPLSARLQRLQLSPRDLPRDELQFVPAKRSGGVIGFLVNRGRSVSLGERSSISFRKSKSGGTRQSALFMLVRKVTQRPRPFLFFDDDDRRTIDQFALEHLEGK